jgi:aminoglycoside phosphotransferase (APT) family kinase protein
MMPGAQGPDRTEAARRALAAHGIGFERLEPITSGLMNEVIRVDRAFVVRSTRHPAGHQRFKRECALVERLRQVVPVPRVIAVGSLGDASYQIWEHVAGEELCNVWPNLPSAGKDRLATELASALRRLHEIRFDDFGLLCFDGGQCPTWTDYLEREFEACLSIVEAAHPPLSDQLGPIGRFFREAAAACDWGPTAHLVHNDLLMTNVLVHEGRLAAILDWELATKGPIDVEVYKLEYFCRAPGIVGRSGDFHDLWERMIHEYPSLFSARDLPRRLDVCDLLSTWRSFRYFVETGNDPKSALPAALEASRRIMAGEGRRLEVPSR